jgi:hypothetical protein
MQQTIKERKVNVDLNLGKSADNSYPMNAEGTASTRSNDPTIRLLVCALLKMDGTA